MNDLTLFEGTFQLSENLVNLLEAKAGDRIVIGYVSNNNELTPTISIGEAGNKLSGKFTVVFKGKQRDTLAKYGTIFQAIPGTPILLKGDNPEFKVFTATKKAVDYALSKDLINNTNFNLKIYNTYEF